MYQFRRFFFELTIRSQDKVIGMGFSDHGETANADFMITWIDKSGKRHVQVNDCHMTYDCHTSYVHL